MSDPFTQPSTGGAGETGDSAYSYDGKADRWKRYRLPDPKTGQPGGFTRATTFAKSISDTFTLSMWQQRMVGKGVAMRPDLLAAFASTPLENREKLNSLSEAAKETAGAKSGANLGSAVHAFTESVDRGDIEVDSIPSPWDRDVNAYVELMKREGLEVVPELIERIVLNTTIDGVGIAGTFDRIVRLTRDLDVRLDGEIVTLRAGELAVFDLKTGKDLEYGWMEIAVQLAVYAHAEHLFSKTTKSWSPMPEMNTRVALVLHLPVGKGVAELHAIDVAKGHDLGRLCAAVRSARKVRGLSVPLASLDLSTVGTGPLTVVSERADVVTDFEDRAIHARTVGDLSALRSEAIRERAWTPKVERLALERRDAILADTAAG